MKADIDSLAVLIRKMEEEFENVIELLVKRDGLITDSDAVFLLIYRKIIEKLDAVFILCDNGHDSSSESLARDIFENYLYLAYINKGNYEYRTQAYQYENLIKQLNLIKWFDPESKKGKKLKNFLRTDNSELSTALKERKAYINRILKSDEFNNIKIDWDRKLKEFTKRKAGSKFPTWYNIGNGAKDISQLSVYTGMSEDYETIYSFFSHQVHSLNALSQMKKIGNNLGTLTPIRDDVTKGLSIQVSFTIGVFSLKIIFDRFHQGGKSSFLKWYTNDLEKEIIKEKGMKQ